MALDKVPAAMMSGLLVSETAPTNPGVGQRWFRLSTAITYQYTNDGTSSFWLDVSSGGIGTSASRGVDFVGDTDPHLETNGSGLAVGSVYYNREKNRHFVCTTATTNANVWSGRYSGAGGLETTYKSGSDFYKIHTFLSSGTFHMDSTTSVDYLMVGGGGGGGINVAGGGGAGGFVYQTGISLSIGSFSVVVGAGGAGVTGSPDVDGGTGVSTTFNSLTASGGGGGGREAGAGLAGGSGGGASYSGAAGTSNQASYSGTGFGNAGGTGIASPNYVPAGGGGAGAVGSNGASELAGTGGIGKTNSLRTGSNVYYAGGGGGGYSANTTTDPGPGGNGGGGAGGGATSAGTNGTDNTGGGGGGSGPSTNVYSGAGGSGIVIIRYAV
jgi:hypothetical protein